jgi:hypothetical protein
VASIVTILLAGGVLLGMAALTIDVGQIYAERAELQNGADAAALAVAQGCAEDPACDVSTGGMSKTLADGNAKRDGVAGVSVVCGSAPAVPALLGCPPNAGPPLTQCLGSVPAGVGGWVEARTETEEVGGGTLLPPSFARALTGNGDYDGTRVAACARAGWGPPSSAQASLAVTFSRCEWDAMTGMGTNYAPAPPYTSSTYPVSYERALYLHNTSGATSCPEGPSGSDLPGGFGWLDSSGCRATVSAEGWVADEPGVAAPNDCKAVLPGLVGKIIYVPIFVRTNGLTGSNGQYLIDGLAAFFLTGYYLPGLDRSSVASGSKLCKGPDKCLYGWFTQDIIPAADLTGGVGGTPRGASVVALVG